MPTITVTPYIPIQSQKFGEIEVEIKDSDFSQIQYQEGKLNLVFDSCLFKKVTIKNSEEINFKEVSLAFIDCYIEDIQISSITSKNISIHFSSSIVSGKIQSKNITSVSANNSFGNNLFLMDIESIDISYTEENIFLRRWLRFMKELNVADYRKILSLKTTYHLHNYRKLNFRGNESNNKKEGLYLTVPGGDKDSRIGYRLTKQDKHLLNINLGLTYSSSNADTQTLITDMRFHSLSITGPSNGKVYIEKCKINNIYLRDFLPKQDVIFYTIGSGNIANDPATNKPEKRKVEIHKCNLDNVWFDNFYFNEFDIISFYRTKFSKAIFSSCNFPDDYKKFENFQSLQNSHYPQNKKDNFHKDQ